MSKRADRTKRLEQRVGTEGPALPTYRTEVRQGVFLTTAPESPVPDCYACQVFASAVIAPDGVARVLTSMAGISRVVVPCKVHQT